MSSSLDKAPKAPKPGSLKPLGALQTVVWRSRWSGTRAGSERRVWTLLRAASEN